MKQTNHRARVMPDLQPEYYDYLGVLFRGKWILLGVFVGFLLLAILYIGLVNPVYKSTSAVKIDTQQQGNILDIPTNAIQNELEVLKSSSISEQVAQKLLNQRYCDSTAREPIQITLALIGDGQSIKLASIRDIRIRLQETVDFEAVRESDIIKITARSPSACEAALIANVFADTYYQHNVYTSRERSRSFRGFLEGQAKQKRALLARAEDSLQHYMQNAGVVSLDEEAKIDIAQLSSLEAQRGTLDLEIQSLRTSLALYRNQVSEQETNVARVMGQANDPYLQALQQQLAQLEVQRDVTAAQKPGDTESELYNDKLRSLSSQIEALRAKLKKRTNEYIQSVLPGGEGGGDKQDPSGYLKLVKQRLLESQIQVQALETKKEVLETAIAGFERKFSLMPGKSIAYARLQREKMSLEKLFLIIDEKYNEANLTEQSQFGYVDVFDLAVVPDRPSSPKVILLLLVAGLSGLVLGVTVVFVRDRLLERVQTPSDIKRAGLTPIATIMDFESEIRQLTGKLRSVVKSHSIHNTLITIANPLSPVSETYRHLQTVVKLGKKGKTTQTILVTSPDPGDGKSTTAANLAVVLAESGSRVLLVGADLRRPKLDSLFGFHDKPGLTDVLQGTTDSNKVIRPSPVEDLSIMPSGPVYSNSSKLLQPEILNSLIEKWRRDFDFVVFDSVPVLAAPDACIIAESVDLVFLVVSAGKTTLTSLMRAEEMLEATGSRISGVILNCFRMRRAYGPYKSRPAYGHYGYTNSYTSPTRDKSPS